MPFSFLKDSERRFVFYFFLALLLYFLDFTPLFSFFKAKGEAFSTRTHFLIYQKTRKKPFSDKNEEEDRALSLCRKENRAAKKVLEENQRLRRLLQLPVAQEGDFLDAWVVGREGDFLVINRGEGDGVFEGQTTIYKDFFLGRVEKVNSKRALVLPVSAARFSLPVVILDSRPDCLRKNSSCQHGKGLLRGGKVEEILLSEPVAEGDEVVPLDDKEGLLIGRVKKVEETGDHVFKEAWVDFPYEEKEVDQIFLIKK